MDVISTITRTAANFPLWGYMVIAGLVLFSFAVRYLIAQGLFRRYKRRSHLLTQTEVRSYRKIEPACNSLGLRLMAQVRIADVINVKGSEKQNGSKRGFWKAFVRISSKHVDFVVVDSNFGIVGCIEIDDRSHQKKDRAKRDVFVNRAFKAAGVPLMRCVPGDENKVIFELKKLVGGA